MDKKGSVLIVDDDQLVLNSLAREIKEDGYETFLAADAKSAMATIKEQQVDIIISDHKMPGVQGLNLLRIIKDHYPDIIRIMLTGYADLEAALSAINEIEVFRFYTKPWNRQELLTGLGESMRVRRIKVETKRLMKTVSEQLVKLKALNPDLIKD